MTSLICIGCPKGCHLQVDEENNYTVSGNACPVGEEYGKKELLHPTRTLTSTVKITGAEIPRIPVKSDGEIPKQMLLEAACILNDVELYAPVHRGDIVLTNILGTNINIIATRSLPKIP